MGARYKTWLSACAPFQKDGNGGRAIILPYRATGEVEGTFIITLLDKFTNVFGDLAVHFVGSNLIYLPETSHCRYDMHMIYAL